MTKKEIIKELVKTGIFEHDNISGLDKSTLEKVYNDYHNALATIESVESVEDVNDLVVEDITLTPEESNGLKHSEDYVETNFDRKLVEKSPVESQQLTKAQRRQLERMGKI